MLKIRYQTPTGVGPDRELRLADQAAVIYLSREDLAALLAGQALHTDLVKLFEGREIEKGLPLILALGGQNDEETEQILAADAAEHGLSMENAPGEDDQAPAIKEVSDGGQDG